MDHIDVNMTMEPIVNKPVDISTHVMSHSMTDFSDVPSSAQTNTGPIEVIEYSKGKGREAWSSHAPNASLMPSDLDIIDADWPIHAIKNT